MKTMKMMVIIFSRANMRMSTTTDSLIEQYKKLNRNEQLKKVSMGMKQLYEEYIVECENHPNTKISTFPNAQKVLYTAALNYIAIMVEARKLGYDVFSGFVSYDVDANEARKEYYQLKSLMDEVETLPLTFSNVDEYREFLTEQFESLLKHDPTKLAIVYNILNGKRVS